MTIEEAIKELQESRDMMRSYNIDESESRLMTALDMAIKALGQEQRWARLWARLYTWLANMHLSIAPDETVTDIDERNVRIAQVDLLDEIMEWMDKPKITNYYINEKGQRVQVDYDMYDMAQKIIEGLETPEANGFRKCGEE